MVHRVQGDIFSLHPDGRNILRMFLSTFGLYKGKSTKEATLRFTPEESKWIKDQIWHKDQKVKLLKDGSLEISFPGSDFSEIKLRLENSHHWCEKSPGATTLSSLNDVPIRWSASFTSVWPRSLDGPRASLSTRSKTRAMRRLSSARRISTRP